MAAYVITDGSRFITKDRKGKFVPTLCESLADSFTRKQAENICKSSLPKALRAVFYVKKIDESPQSQLVKQVTVEEISQNTEKVLDADNIKKWLDKVSGLNGLAKDASNRKQELLTQLKRVENEMCDVQHYIEFCNLNAAQGYKAYKMLQDILIKRRSIKNELDVLQIILGKRISESVVEQIQRSVARMDVRQYEPRVLKELFDV